MTRMVWRELLNRKWSLFWYGLVVVALLWMYAATYKSSMSSTQQLMEVIKSYPKALVEAFGLNSLVSSTIEQFLNGKHFSFIWPLLAVILAFTQASSQIAGEISDKTMGLLLSMPLRRTTIFAAKYVAGFITTVAFTALSLFPIIPLAADYGIATHPRILVATWVLSTLFMWAVYSFGLLISSFVTSAGRVFAIGGGALFVSYSLNITALLNHNLAWLKYGSIFHYFDTATVLGTGHIGIGAITVFVGIIGVSSLLGAWQFNRRNIQV